MSVLQAQDLVDKIEIAMCLLDHLQRGKKFPQIAFDQIMIDLENEIEKFKQQSKELNKISD